MKPHRSFVPFYIAALCVAVSSGSLQAAVTFTVSELVPDGDFGGGSEPGAGTGARFLATTLGSVSAPSRVGATSAGAPLLPTLTYTVTGLDLTAVGGSASDSVVFKVDFTHTGGTGVAFSTFGNIAIAGGATANQVSVTGETITSTLSFVSTTFAGGLSNLSFGFTRISVGGFNTDESADFTHANGTTSMTAPNNNGTQHHVIQPSGFFTYDPTNGPSNLAGYNVLVTAVPEPSGVLLGGIGLLGLFRRRR